MSLLNVLFQWRAPTTLGTLASDSLLPSFLKGEKGRHAHVCVHTHIRTHTHTETKKKRQELTHCVSNPCRILGDFFPALSPQPRFLLLGRPRTQMVKFLTFAFSKYRAPISSWSLSQSSSSLSNSILSTAFHIFLSRLLFLFDASITPSRCLPYFSDLLCMLLEWTSGSHLLTPC